MKKASQNHGMQDIDLIDTLMGQSFNDEISKIVSEYDQEIPQSQTAGNPWHREEEPLNHHETSGRQIKQSNQLSFPYQKYCNTRMDTK